MSETRNTGTPRREFLKTTGKLAAAATLLAARAGRPRGRG